MARKDLSVEVRQVVGKKVAQLRRSGFMPGNVYGNGLDSVAVQVKQDTIDKALKSMVANEVIDLKIDGESATRPVVVQKVQRHPLTSRVLHTEFYQVSLRTRMRADVPLVMVGKSEGIDTYNGVLVHALEVIQVEALPLDLPARIEVDITPLAHLEDTLQVKDLPIPDNVTLLTDPELVIVKIATPRVSAELEEEEAAAAEAAAEAAGETAEDGEESGGSEGSSDDEKSD